MIRMGMDTSFEMDAGDMSPGEMADALRELPDVLMEHLTNAARKLGTRIGRDAAENAPRDMGQLQADLIVPTVETIGEFVVRARIGSNLPQAPPHEFGLDAGEVFPPSDALRPWARRVLGDPDLAFVVARAIHDRGIEEQRFLRDAYDDHLEAIAEVTTQAVDSALREVGLR